jgi:hypothetical protein
VSNSVAVTIASIRRSSPIDFPTRIVLKSIPRQREVFALSQDHDRQTMFIVRNGCAPLQLPAHRPFCSGMAGRRHF